MDHPSILTCEDLRAITGYQRPADIERCLVQQGIKMFRGRLGPWTTIDLINQAGGLRSHSDSGDYYGPEIL